MGHTVYDMRYGMDMHSPIYEYIERGRGLVIQNGMPSSLPL